MNAVNELREAVLDWYYKQYRNNGDGFYLPTYTALGVKYYRYSEAKRKLQKAVNNSSKTEARALLDPHDAKLNAEAVKSREAVAIAENFANVEKFEDESAVNTAFEYLCANKLLVENGARAEGQLFSASITQDGIERVEALKPPSSLTSMTGLASAALEFLKTVGSLIAVIGTVWLTAYFALIVHSPPEADIAKLAIIISIIGATGTFIVGVLISMLLAPSIAWLSGSQANMKDSIDLFKVRVSDRNIIIMSSYLFMEFIALVMFRALRIQIPTDFLFLILLFLIAFLVSFPQGRIIARKIYQCYRGMDVANWITIVGSIILWIVASTSLLSVLATLTSQSTPQTSVILIFVLFPMISILIALVGSVYRAVVFGTLVLVLICVFYADAGKNILTAPARFIGIGYDYRDVTALTNRAANALMACVNPLPSEEKKKRLKINGKWTPYRVDFHYRAFVLSDVGSEFIFQCEQRQKNSSDANIKLQNTRLILPKTEITQATSQFPPGPLPTPFAASIPQAPATPSVSNNAQRKGKP